MFDLMDYRRRVSSMYYRIRQHGTQSSQAWVYYREVRDELFREHPQSPLDADQKARFTELRYFNYDPAYRIVAAINTAVEPRSYDYDLGEDGAFTIRQFGEVTVDLPTGSGTLGLFWITGYGGGVFLPFCDATNNQDTYGGGRYLLDTIKGADLGRESDRIVLDFNYAYNPSCVYNPRWVCPLAPPENQLDFPVRAGELLPEWD
jgi:uncharacterized protein (DUF1684 family)